MRLIDADKLGFTDFEILLCNGDYKEGLKLLLKKIEDAETIEQPKESSDTTKTTASCDNPDKIESSIKPGDINNDLDLKIREAEDEAAVAELISKSNNSCLGQTDWKKKAREKRQLVRWLKELKYYKENDNDKDEFYEWVYRKDTDRLHCSYCGASSSYDSHGPIQTPYCCYCGKKMLRTWDYHDIRRVGING
jgi:hypothetical protein